MDTLPYVRYVAIRYYRVKIVIVCYVRMCLKLFTMFINKNRIGLRKDRRKFGLKIKFNSSSRPIQNKI